MLKKIISLIRNKAGDTIDAVIIAPLWIFIMFIIAVQMSIHRANQELEDTMQIVTRYVMLAETPADAIDTVNNYLATREENGSHYYEVFDKTNITGIYYKNNSTYVYTSNYDDIENYWVPGTMVEITLVRKTPYAGNSIMKFCVYNNEDLCYSIISERVYSKMTAILISL